MGGEGVRSLRGHGVYVSFSLMKMRRFKAYWYVVALRSSWGSMYTSEGDAETGDIKTM